MAGEFKAAAAALLDVALADCPDAPVPEVFKVLAGGFAGGALAESDPVLLRRLKRFATAHNILFMDAVLVAAKASLDTWCWDDLDEK